MNPLLSRDFLLPFDDIKPEHVEPGVHEALTRAESELETLLSRKDEPTFDNTLGALDALTERLNRAMSLAYHLTSVATSPELRAAYNAVLPAYSTFFAKLPLNASLWARLKAFADTPEARALTGVEKRHLDKTVQEFVRAGADLSDTDKARVEAIKVELSQVQTKFSENLLDATNAFDMVLTDEAELAGLPASVREQAKQNAAAKGLAGYRFTLQAPSYMPFIKFSERRDLRRKLYEAYTTRADSGEHNNRALIIRILALRRELAELLGYYDFADYRLEVNMVGSGEAARAFEAELFEKTLPYWRDEVAGLTTYADKELGLATLEAWDVPYTVEKMRKASFDLDEEELRPYFPLNNVLTGLFSLVERVFGVKVSKQANTKVWHPEVAFYTLHDEAGTHLGSFYTDLFPREEKRAGAWKNGFIIGGPSEGGFDPHLAFIAANFTPPQGNQPALLTHNEVNTLFHEFGHLLHHLLSRVSVRERGGTNVPWDWVELPSQLMENWVWEREALSLLSRHIDTGEAIPDDLFERMSAARTFMEANAQIRQLSFGTVDLALHTDYDPDKDGEPVAYANRLMERFSIRPEFARTSFLTAFSHVFAGSYAAGYYSYKWSEVLDADAFTRFKREGIFNRETGQAYVDAILSRGDSADPSDLFREFMGRDPDVNALLKRNLGAAAPTPVAH